MGQGGWTGAGGGRRGRGFTLIELIVALSILGVLAAVAVPSFQNAMLSSKLSGFASSFMSSAQLARSEAIKRNGPVVLCRSADGNGCSASGGWEQGWLVFADTGAGANKGNGEFDPDETRIHWVQVMLPGFSFSGDAYTVVFDGSGLSTPNAELVFCRREPVGSQERRLRVRAGRVSNEVTRTGTCA